MSEKPEYGESPITGAILVVQDLALALADAGDEMARASIIADGIGALLAGLRLCGVCLQVELESAPQHRCDPQRLEWRIALLGRERRVDVDAIDPFVDDDPWDDEDAGDA